MKLLATIALTIYSTLTLASSCPQEVVNTQVLDYLSSELGVDYADALEEWKVENQEVATDLFEATVITNSKTYALTVQVDQMCDIVEYTLKK